MKDISNNNIDKFRRTAFWLAWFTIIYNFAEGIIAIGFGIQDESVSLFGFGADSMIEMSSAFVVLWKMKGELGMSAPASAIRERRATRIIGILLALLTIITFSISIRQLFLGEHPETTIPGIVVSAVSLSFMYFLYRSKIRIAIALDSSTLKADAYCSLSCMYLSVVLFVGSILFMMVPALWWVDSMSAILLAALIGKESLERIRGEECCENKCT